MHTVTATEASRAFAALLDDAERGETIVITRGGKQIATIGPAAQSNGAALLAIVERRVDDMFGDDVAAARTGVTLEEPSWPVD
jgi:prevent-host-death family protein